MSRSPLRDKFLELLEPNGGRPIIVTAPRSLIKLCGHPILALMLSQLLYWTDRATREDGFVYKSYADWYDEVGASEHYIQIFNKLPYIETKRIKANGFPTTHYRIRREVLEAAIAEYWVKELGKSLTP